MVKTRQFERTAPDVLEHYGGGEVWPPAAAWDLGEIAPNGNYLENDDIAVSHGACGDTPQVRIFCYSLRFILLSIYMFDTMGCWA